MNFWKAAVLVLPLASGMAQAMEGGQSPITTVLQPSKRAQSVTESTGRAMIAGFLACDPAAALPESALAPLGVLYVDRHLVGNIRFSYPELLRNRKEIVLVGNDHANLEKSPNGSFLVYGGKYRLEKPVKVGSVEIRTVASMITDYPPAATVGVTYVFKESSRTAIKALETDFGAKIRTSGGNPQKTGAVWFTEGEDGHSLSCWRRLN